MIHHLECRTKNEDGEGLKETEQSDVEVSCKLQVIGNWAIV